MSRRLYSSRGCEISTYEKLIKNIREDTMMIKSEVELIITLAVQRKIGQVGKASWIWGVDDLAEKLTGEEGSKGEI